MSDRRPRRSRALRALVCALLALAVVVPASLWGVGHAATLQVDAVTGVPQCEGTEPTTTVDDFTGFEEPAIRMKAGFECMVSVRVRNDGNRATHLGRISVPIAGPQGGAGFEVTHVAHHPVSRNQAVEAATDLDVSLEPGEEHQVDLRFVFRRSGCSSPGSQTWTEPTIKVRGLIATRELRVRDLPAFLGTKDTSCDT